MVTVKVKDKRHWRGQRVAFFRTDKVSDEVIQFVKKRPNAYLISDHYNVWTRDEFLKEFSGDKLP